MVRCGVQCCDGVMVCSNRLEGDSGSIPSTAMSCVAASSTNEKNITVRMAMGGL